jgi:hypothetical protein
MNAMGGASPNGATGEPWCCCKLLADVAISTNATLVCATKPCYKRGERSRIITSLVSMLAAKLRFPSTAPLLSFRSA